MSRTIIEAERSLPYSATDLCKLVGDVRAYPKFIPWLKRLKVLREAENQNGGWDGEAEVFVGWQALTERFTCKIRCNPAAGAVDVTGLKGPFRSLEKPLALRAGGEWRRESAFLDRLRVQKPIAAIAADGKP